jgi:hypothetical protein
MDKNATMRIKGPRRIQKKANVREKNGRNEEGGKKYRCFCGKQRQGTGRKRKGEQGRSVRRCSARRINR